MKINKQRIRFFTALLLCILFVIGCGSGKLTGHLSHSGAQETVAVHADGRYVYQTLSSKRQHTYDQMLTALMNMRESVRLTTRDPEEVQTAMKQSVLIMGRSSGWKTVLPGWYLSSDIR